MMTKDERVAYARHRRQAIGITQDEAAALADIGSSTIRVLERGRGCGARTLPAVERAFGYVIVGGEPRELLSAESVRAAAGVIVPALRPSRVRDSETVEGQRLRIEWHALISALAADPPTVPDGFGYLWDRLRNRLRPATFAAIDAELRSVVPIPPPRDPAPAPDRAEQHRSRPSDADSVGSLIIHSRLPPATQAALIDYLAVRRRQIETALIDEFRAAIEMARPAARTTTGD